MDPAWRVQHGPVVLELKLTDFGHLGVFPEQAANWTWIARQVRAVDRPLSVLNLFAYTGAATLAAAAAGAEVAHVDAAANVVAWARRNAALSGLADAPIRWIAEDALKFARRELKRGRRYDAVILDPPSYGHGPRGQAWKLADKLDDLVDVCLQLTAGRREFVLLTCHSGDWAVAAPLLAHFVSQKTAFGDEGKLTAQNMALVSADGQRLHAGAAIRWRRVTDAKSQPPGRERQPIRSRGER
jgi:23S rRNA (cytosine1962-C5)-methyltransferase